MFCSLMFFIYNFLPALSAADPQSEDFKIYYGYCSPLHGPIHALWYILYFYHKSMFSVNKFKVGLYCDPNNQTPE